MRSRGGSAGVGMALLTVCALGCGSSGGGGPLMAPLLDAIAPVPLSAGVPGVHVGWTNETPDCDAVEGERKDGLHSYAVAFSVPGTATSKDDFTATQNQNYTYRLRCKKGAAYSPYSNEESANPQVAP